MSARACVLSALSAHRQLRGCGHFDVDKTFIVIKLFSESAEFYVNEHCTTITMLKLKGL